MTTQPYNAPIESKARILFRGTRLPLLFSGLATLVTGVSAFQSQNYLQNRCYVQHHSELQRQGDTCRPKPLSIQDYSGMKMDRVLALFQDIHESDQSPDVVNDGEYSMNPNPQRKRLSKNMRRKRKIKRRLRPNTSMKVGAPLSSEEIANHVSSRYLHGPGGTVNMIDAKRNRLKESNSIFENDPAHQEQISYLRKLDQHLALVLNADYQPLSVLPLSLWSWQETVKAVFSGKVTVVDVYPEMTVRAVNMDLPLPSVIALTEYVAQPHTTPAFTRRNVFLRDGYRCQYCGNLFRTQDLSLDHVIPRSKGGTLNWENTVTCCKKCNGKKGSLLPSELKSVGMRLIREPRTPNKFELATEASRMMPRRVHPTWKPFLGMDDVPEEASEKMGSLTMEEDGMIY